MKKYCIILDEEELKQCKQHLIKHGVPIETAANTSKLIRYIIRQIQDKIIFYPEIKINTRN